MLSGKTEQNDVRHVVPVTESRLLECWVLHGEMTTSPYRRMLPAHVIAQHRKGALVLLVMLSNFLSASFQHFDLHSSHCVLMCSVLTSVHAEKMCCLLNFEKPYSEGLVFWALALLLIASFFSD